MRKYYTHIILIVLALVLYFMANFQRVAVPGAMFDVLRSQLNVSAPYITALSAIFMYSYAISLLFCGILVDRYGAVKVILCGSLLFTLGAVIFPNTTNIYILYFSRVLLGVGAASFYLSLVQEAKKCFPDKYFGISVSLMLITGYLGGVFANAPFNYLMQFFSWQSILSFMGIITLIVTLLFYLERIFLHHIPINPNAKFSVKPFKEVLTKPFNHNLFVFAGLNYGLYYVIQTVLGVKFLKDFVNLSDINASVILSSMIIIAGISGFSLASLSTMFNNRRVIFMKGVCILTSCIFALISIFILFNFRTPIIAFLLMLIAIGGGMSPLLIPIIHATNKYEFRGTALSIMNSCFFITVGILGTLSGFLLDVFPPILNTAGNYIYGQKSYLLIFGTFFLFSLIEMYNVFKLKDV